MRKIKNSRNQKLKLLAFVVFFGALGAYFVFASFARQPYNPYNPKSETGIATYYDNTVVGGQGTCAAIHYERGKLLRVTNKKPGPQYNRSILCRVSDAGPFGEGRVIDLNTDDFVILAGGTSVGVVPVKLELTTLEAEKKAAKKCANNESDSCSLTDIKVVEKAPEPAQPESEEESGGIEKVAEFTKDNLQPIVKFVLSQIF